MARNVKDFVENCEHYDLTIMDILVPLLDKVDRLEEKIKRMEKKDE